MPATGPSGEAIDYFSSGHRLRGVATKLALRARTKMYARFVTAVQFDATSRVVDIGVTPDEALADSNFFEQFYPHTANVTATSIEDAQHLERRFPGLRFVRTDGATLPFADASFDVAFSAAVLEHVGDRRAQVRFVHEACRVSNSVFLTTPNRWFPVELHTFLPLLHWLPRRWHQACLRRLRREFWAQTDNLNLVSAPQLSAMFPADWTVRIDRHRTLGWTSNLIAVGTRAAPYEDR
jgi:SAM-dependent methyltransferase